MTPGVVAAFDFDGTITRGDTLLPFLRRLCGGRAVARALARLPGGVIFGRRFDREAAKVALLSRLLRGRAVADVEEAAERYADDVVRTFLRPEVVERLEWHRDRGDRVVVVSASPEIVVGAVVRRLGVDIVLATRLEVDDEGRLTGRLVGMNVRGAEKVARLRAHLGDEQVEVWAYGDSSGDRELLAHAAVPIWVRRRTITRSGRDLGTPVRRGSRPERRG